MLTEALWKQLSENPVTSLNTLLILGSIYLGYTGYVFQTRTSVRESLEQLDALEVELEKLQPILYNFTYFPLLTEEVIVQLKSYQKGDVTDVSTPTNILHRKIHRRGFGSQYTGNTIRRDDYLQAVQYGIGRIEGVDDAEIRQRDILLTMHTTNAVDVRRVTEEVLEFIHDWFLQHPREIEARTRMIVGDDFQENSLTVEELG